MRIRYYIITLSLIIVSLFMLSSCQSTNNQNNNDSSNDSNLLEMTYNDKDSAVTMTLEGEKYFLVGAAPDSAERNQKIAKVKTEDNIPNSYAYTIQGYNDRDFLIVEDRTVGLDLSTYVNEKIKSIPFELLAGNVILDGDEFIKFNDKNYYYFSKTASDFLVDTELSQIQRNGKTVKAYKVKEQPESEWIAVKDESFYSEGYLLYWIRGTSLPREYIEIWRTNGK